MELFPNAPKTYATRENAIKALAKHADLNMVHWLIIATPDGRFAPCVRQGHNEVDTLALVHKGICLVG